MKNHRSLIIWITSYVFFLTIFLDCKKDTDEDQAIEPLSIILGNTFWSSSQIDQHLAWMVRFDDDQQHYEAGKMNFFKIRGVRNF